jgi:signal peptidase II
MSEEPVDDVATGLASQPADLAPAPDAPPPPSVVAPVGKPDYVFLAAVAGVSLATDLLSKWWAKARHESLINALPSDPDLDKYRWFDGHLKLIYAENPGGAFGLLGREPPWLRVPTFIVISIAAIWFILHLYRRLEPRQKALKLGLPLVFAGAIGNLADRVRFNYVVDFIDVSGHWVRSINGVLGNASDHWPTFNVADIVIVAGVGLMAIDMFQSRKPKPVAPPKVDVVVTPPAAAETRAESRTEG